MLSSRCMSLVSRLLELLARTTSAEILFVIQKILSQPKGHCMSMIGEYDT